MKNRLYIVLVIFLLTAKSTLIFATQKQENSLKVVLKNIEKELDIKFNYDDKIILKKKATFVYDTTKDFKDQLTQLLEKHKLTFHKLDSRTYVIVQKSGNIKKAQKANIDKKEYNDYSGSSSGTIRGAVGKSLQNMIDKITITGVVTSATDNEPIPGANIVIFGTRTGTITDFVGNFKLEVDETDSIEVTFVGFKPKLIAVAGRSAIYVTLEEDVQALEEVVIVGYGTTKKSDLTGSISSISSDDITQVATSSIDQALQGRAAGVHVQQVSGRPGGESSIRIRGSGSITAGNEPLYVVDGMMITSNGSVTTAGANRGATINPLASINPNDIESIEILKDASATAIYGSRGSNGVILITTKRGSAGQSNIDVNAYYGIQEVRKKLGVLTGEGFANYINDFDVDRNFPLNPNYLVPEKFGVGTDWQDAIFRQAPIQSYQVSFTGGDTKTKYLVSGGVFSQDGIIIESDFKRANFRLNLDRKINDKLDLGTSVGVSYIKSSGVLTNNGTLLPGVSATSILFPPTQPIFNSNVRGGYTFQDNHGRNLANPYADAVEVDDNSMNLRVMGALFMTYEIIPKLKYKLNFGFDLFSTKENRFEPNFLKRAEPTNGTAVVATINGGSWLVEHTLSYSNSWAEKHKVDAVVGFTTQAFNSEILQATNFDFEDNKTGYHVIGKGLNPQSPGTLESAWGIVSYLGRVNYILSDKYLFTATGRVDGSSKFGENNKYGVFPSISFAWRLSDEDFFPASGVIEQIKIRTSYGVIGNEQIPSNSSLLSVGITGQGTFSNSEPYNGQTPLRYSNPNIRWERANQVDLGMDVDLIDGRLNATLDYYNRFTSDLLLNDQIAYTTGFSSTVRNVGSVLNQGVELTLNSVNIDKELYWATDFNISKNKNQVKDLTANGKDVLLGGALFLPTGWSILREGEPIGSFFGHQTDGIFQSEDEIANSPLLTNQVINQNVRPGDRKFKDLNGRNSEGNLTGEPDGIIDEADRVVLGQASPSIVWGLNNTLRYKNFELNVFVQGTHGNKVANVNLFEIGTLNGETNVLQEYYENRWTETNKNNVYPRIRPDSDARGIFSDAHLEDGQFVRIQNITLGYNLSPDLLSKLHLRKLRMYLSANNFFTLTNYSGYDPEVNAFGQSTLGQGADYGGYPTAKSILLGLQIGL